MTSDESVELQELLLEVYTSPFEMKKSLSLEKNSSGVPNATKIFNSACSPHNKKLSFSTFKSGMMYN